MASLSSPNPALLAQCFTLVRWLHANRISWSGTASELACQLLRDCDAALWFTDTDELVAFLETNADMLQQLGLKASVRRLPGRPRFLELQIIHDEVVPKPGGPIEVVSPLSELESRISEAGPSIEENRRSETNAGYVPQFANWPDAASATKLFTPSEPVTRLNSLLGLSAEEAVVEESREDVVEKRSRFEGLVAKVNGDNVAGRFLPFILAGAVLVFAALAFGFVHYRTVNAQPAMVTSPPAASAESAPSIDPVEAVKTKTLLQQASTSRSPSPQYDVAMRYEDGRGVARDHATAYAWLSVPRSYVVAHNWFSLAELAGSTEALPLKKQLESKMSPDQLERADRPTAAH